MTKFEFKFDTKKLEKQLNKQINEIIRKEQNKLINVKNKERGKMNILNKNSEEILKVLLNKYEEKHDLSITGVYEDFPKNTQFCIKDIMENLKQNDYISNYFPWLNGWNVIIAPEALEYFEMKGKRIELFNELVDSERELLKEIIEIENNNGNISEFLAEKVNNDERDIQRGIIGTLQSNGLLNVFWASNTVTYATLTQAGRTFFEREQKYKERNPQYVYINGNQVNIAKDNATLLATQNNGITEFNELVKILKENIEKENITEDLKKEILENTEGIMEELNRNSPRKGILKSFSEGLNQSIKLIPNVMEVSANIATIISFLQSFINK